ncbi:invasion associated locus B family protein [Bombella sp. ESL0385]|uniref:invasion associated locus B family protein n=1 Tax=Bombella sp. ESL0385 TaxID=2676446 RepID=UPI0012D95CFF|nr:invasion associated locus B family protein [Bombella sp. ESL0385]MUG90483.1 hypothetical protein [Bombella sp. ESL0385]
MNIKRGMFLAFCVATGAIASSASSWAADGTQATPVVISGSAAAWTYRCVFPADNLSQGPQVCLAQQALTVQGDKGKTEALGAVILARATENVTTTPLTRRPWRLTVMVPLTLSLKTDVRVVLDDNPPIKLSWQSCATAGCMASLDLSADQVTRLRVGKTGHIIADKVGGGTLTINFALDGSNAALHQLDSWIQKSPFRQ